MLLFWGLTSVFIVLVNTINIRMKYAKLSLPTTESSLDFCRDSLIHESASNMSCYCSKPSEDINSLEEKHTPRRNSIFFIDTSCNGELDFRQACSIEAVARLHTETDVNILFAGPVTMKSLTSLDCWEILRYPNVNIYRVHISTYLKGTPLERLAKEQRPYLFQHLPEILKFVTLYKYGGIYVDFNGIIVKSLYTLPEWRNFAGRVTMNLLGSGIMGISKDRIGGIISDGIFRIIKDNLRNNTIWQTSEEILTKTLQSVCKKSEVKEMRKLICKGFEVYDPYFFYTVRPDNWKNYFSFTNGGVPPKPYAFFIWNYTLLDQPVYKNSPYARLLDSNCPRMKKAYYVTQSITPVKISDDLMSRYLQ